MSNSDYDLLKSKSDITGYRKNSPFKQYTVYESIELGYGNPEYSNCWFHIKI